MIKFMEYGKNYAKGKCTVINTYSKREGSRNPTLYCKYLKKKKKKKTKPNISRKKQVREIHGAENKIIEKMLLEMINIGK